MSKAPVDIIKYIIHAKAEANGLVEKPDLIGAIFGQTEGLLGEDLDLRELQKSGRIGRIDANVETKKGVTNAEVTIPSSLDMVETSIIAAGVETISRIGPCDAKFTIAEIEDVREAKRAAVVSRAREILKDLISSEIPDAKEITEEVRGDMRSSKIVKFRELDAGPEVEDSDAIIIVEGRADVLNLLRNGIKNAVAVGGIKIPKAAIDLCNQKVATVFVDGDRGGDLIIKSLVNAGAHIENIARAPTGREVENLARKEIIMALRRKASAQEAIDALGDTRESVREPKRRDDRRSGSRDSRDRDSRSSESRSSDSRSRSSESRSRSSESRPSRTRESGRGRNRGDRPERDGSFKERAPRESSSSAPSMKDKLLEKLSGVKNGAVLLDEKLEVVKELKPEDLKKKMRKKAFAIVVDDIITAELIENAGNVEYIVGLTMANNLNVPDGKVVITNF